MLVVGAKGGYIGRDGKPADPSQRRLEAEGAGARRPPSELPHFCAK
jgi:hypothetical protein